MNVGTQAAARGWICWLSLAFRSQVAGGDRSRTRMSCCNMEVWHFPHAGRAGFIPGVQQLLSRSHSTGAEQFLPLQGRQDSRVATTASLSVATCGGGWWDGCSLHLAYRVPAWYGRVSRRIEACIAVASSVPRSSRCASFAVRLGPSPSREGLSSRRSRAIRGPGPLFWFVGAAQLVHAVLTRGSNIGLGSWSSRGI